MHSTPLCIGSLRYTCWLMSFFSPGLLHRYSWWRHPMEHFQHYWPFVREIHRSTVDSSNKGQWRGALMYSLICAWTNGWVYNGNAGDLRPHRVHYDVAIMVCGHTSSPEPVKQSSRLYVNALLKPNNINKQTNKQTNKKFMTDIFSTTRMYQLWHSTWF